MKQSVNQVIKKKNGKIVDYNETIINKEVHVSSFKITGMNEETVRNFGALMHLLWLISNEAKYNENCIALHKQKRIEFANKMGIKRESVTRYLQRLIKINAIVIYDGCIYLNPSMLWYGDLKTRNVRQSEYDKIVWRLQTKKANR